jgi:retinol-binding protein 3
MMEAEMKKVILSVMAFVCSLSNTFSQEIPKITNKEKKEVINNLCTLVKNEYVIAETGNIISKKINENLKAGKYNSIKNMFQMCDTLISDLRAISKDEHFGVVYSPEYIRTLRTTLSEKDSIESEKTQIKEGQKNNFGFKELSILDGNIGYLNFTAFHELRHAKATITAAMNFLSNTEAIIIDLRNNTGGSLDMPPYLASYFLSDDKKVLLQFKDRKNEVNNKTETTQQLDGKRLFGKPLYILTSNETISAAEAFIYSLKNRNAAIVIGETTKGAANPNEIKVLTENFLVFLPKHRPIDPLTGTNWEGTGIQPDIEVTADKAKETAHIKAIENIANQASNPDAKWLLDILKGKYNPVTVNEQSLKSYAGKYGIRTIMYENNTMYYQKQGQSKIKMIPISETTFMLENIIELKIEIVIENKIIKGFNKIYIDGRIEFEKRD